MGIGLDQSKMELVIMELNFTYSKLIIEQYYNPLVKQYRH